MNPWTAFITGLTTGGLSCLAVQGGLLFGLLAQRDLAEEGNEPKSWKRFTVPILAFLVAKLAAYTLLGIGLGWLGSRLQLSSTVRIWLQGFAALFMILTGIKLFWPQFLPWLSFTPHAKVRRMVRQQSKNTSWYAPAILGALMIFVPCGTTQAMEVSAIASGTVLQATAIMFAFVLGTMPLFFIIGIMAKSIAGIQRHLQWVTAVLVIGIGLYTMNGVMILAGSPLNFQTQATRFQAAFSGGSSNTGTATDDVTINVLSNGYNPSNVTVAAGKEVKLHLLSNSLYGCTSVFRIAALNVEKTLPTTGQTDITATFPSPGSYTFSCGMGMYTGTINAI